MQREARMASINQPQQENAEETSEISGGEYEPQNKMKRPPNNTLQKKSFKKKKRNSSSEDEDGMLTETEEEEISIEGSETSETWQFACICGIKGLNYDGKINFNQTESQLFPVKYVGFGNTYNVWHMKRLSMSRNGQTVNSCVAIAQ